MKHPLSPVALLFLGSVLWPQKAEAQISRVFVSVNGNDANDCLQPVTSCRTLNGGIARVDSEGEVIVIDTGSFAGATITKSVKIDVPTGVVAFSASSVVINAPGATVVIRGLTLKALTVGSGNGINIQAAAKVHVERCVLDGWSDGIRVQSAAGAVKLVVKESTFRGNDDDGIWVESAATVSIDQSHFEKNSYAGFEASADAKVAITRSFFDGNDVGVRSGSVGAQINVARSTVSGNSLNGVRVFSGTVALVESIIVANGIGLANVGGTLQSFKDNVLAGNTTPTSGSITAVARQ